MGVKENRKRNLQKEQEEKILQYIPEEHPEPAIIKQGICRCNPETVPAFCKQSTALHQIHVFKGSEKNRVTTSNNRKALTLRSQLAHQE